MKTLSVRQPHASEIASGRKRIEYRTWKTGYRGPLLIAASKRKSGSLPTGCAICVVDLVDITGVEGDYRWHLANVRPVENVPIKGKLSLYETPDDLIRIADEIPGQGGGRQADHPQHKTPVVHGGAASAIRRRKSSSLHS